MLILVLAAGVVSWPGRDVVAAPETGAERASVPSPDAVERAVERGDLATARRLLEAVVEARRDDPAPRVALARILLALRDPAAAVSAVDGALAIAPGDRMARLVSGDARSAAGDLAGAIAEYGRILEAGPTPGRASDLRIARLLLEKRGLDVDLEVAARRDLVPVDWPYALAARRREVLVALTRGPGWPTVAERRSAHFLVRTDAGSVAANALATHLERARTVYDAVLPAARASADAPTLVLGFTSHTEYARYLGVLAGTTAFVPSTSGLYFPDARCLAVRLRGPVEAVLPVVYHEAFHLVADQRVGRLPKWLNEGLAEALSARALAGSVGATAFPPARIEGLRARVRSGGVPRVRDVLAIPDPAFIDAVRAPEAYSLAWALVEFLLQTDARDEVARTRTLLADLARGVSEVEAVGEALGPAPHDALDASFGAFVKEHAGGRLR